jgi:hypothetical protein
MVNPRKAAVLVLGVAGLISAGVACQTLAGVDDDKQLDPSLGSGGTAGSGGSGGTSGTEAGIDAPIDVAPDVADAGSDVLDASTGAHPPERPPGDAAASGSTTILTFAVRRFYLGTVNPETDNIQLDAWRGFGFDYDNECTTEQNASSTCQLPTNAKAMSLEDGDECRDNTGGHLLAEVLTVLDSSFEKKIHNGTFNANKPTIILQIEDLDVGPNDPYAPGRLYVTAPKDGGMLWDGNDLLEVDVESLRDGGIADSKYELPNGYVRNNVWVSGDFKGPPMVVPMMVLNVIAPVPAETATMTVTLDDEHVEAQGGMFAGALNTLTLEPLLRIGMLEATGCNESMAQYGISMFLPNRDLGNDDDFIDPSAECGLMSIAVGMELKRVRPPQTSVIVPPSTSSCDAGPG